MFQLHEYRNEKNDDAKLAMLDKTFEKDEIDEPAFQEEVLNDLFARLLFFVDLIKKDQNNVYEVDNFQDVLDGMTELIVDHFAKTTPTQFISLIHAICVLNGQIVYNQIRVKLIYITIKLMDNYSDLIAYFLNSDEIGNFTKIFSGIYLSCDQSFLSAILTKSSDSVQVLIQNGLLDNIFNGFQSTLIQIFPNFNVDEKPVKNAEKYELEKLIFNYWIRAVTSLERIAQFESADNSAQISIFKFTIKFLTRDFYNISSSFVSKVIDCISTCISFFKKPDLFDFNLYTVLLVEILFGLDKNCRKSVLNLFKTVSEQPFLYIWDQTLLISITENILKWYGENDYFNCSEYLSPFFDFISNILCYQFVAYDTLNSISFFDLAIQIFNKESHNLKIHMINLFMNLAVSQLWPKTIEFYLKYNIVTELFLFLESVNNDNDFSKNILCCLLQIATANILKSSHQQKTLIVQEFQSETAMSALASFESDDPLIDELVTSLTSVIQSL